MQLRLYCITLLYRVGQVDPAPVSLCFLNLRVMAILALCSLCREVRSCSMCVSLHGVCVSVCMGSVCLMFAYAFADVLVHMILTCCFVYALTDNYDPHHRRWHVEAWPGHGQGLHVRVGAGVESSAGMVQWWSFPS